LHIVKEILIKRNVDVLERLVDKIHKLLADSWRKAVFAVNARPKHPVRQVHPVGVAEYGHHRVVIAHYNAVPRERNVVQVPHVSKHAGIEGIADAVLPLVEVDVLMMAVPDAHDVSFL
jgi:hypothetical protein